MSLNFLDKLQSIHEQANNLHLLHQQDPGGPLARLLSHACGITIRSDDKTPHVIIVPESTTEIADLRALAAKLPECGWRRDGADWQGVLPQCQISLVSMEPKEQLERIVFKREEALGPVPF